MHKNILNKKFLILILILISIPIITGLDECEQTTEPEDIDCLITSTYNYTIPCNSHEAVVYNSTGQNVINYTFDDFQNGLCFITWNITRSDTYYFVVDNGDTGYITVGVKEMMLNIEGGTLLYFFTLLWIVLLAMTFTIKGSRGKVIQFFNIMQMVVGFTAGTMMTRLSFVIGFPMILISLGIFLGLIMYDDI